MNIFVSYRHVEPDSRFLQRLVTHLKSIADDVTVWTDKSIEPADTWRREIEQAIQLCDVAVVLVSADFAASPFIRDVELPMLLKAHRQDRLRLVPLFVGPTGVLPPGIADVQGANSPAKPLVSMTRAKQEATFADLVTWLGASASAGGAGRSTDRPHARADVVALERVPAGGLLFDRAKIREDITGFLNSRHQRICVVHGFPGIGKTVLAAHMVETHRAQFADIFWMTCRDNERSGRLMIARLDAFLQRNGDDSLRGLVENMADIDPEGINAAVVLAVQALAGAGYLLVLDEFQAFLGTSNDVPDEITRRLIGALVRAAGDTKLLVLSDRRPALEPCADLFPTGAALEQEILGLPDDAVQELLRECGLDVPDAQVRRLITDHFAGNPTLLRVYCSFVTRHHRDPLDSLVGFASGGPVAALIGDTVTSLGRRSRQTLERLAVLRAPLNWDQLGHFGLETDAIVTLLDSSLVSLDPTSHTIAMSPVVREFTLQATQPGDVRVAHRLAAAGYEQPGASSPPRSYDDLRPLIESGNHRIAAGDINAGASAILDAVELLVRWGYADLADHEIDVAEAHSEDAAILARCALQRGRIADQRGQLDVADRLYRSAANQAESVRADQTVADALFRIGRILNARNDFAAAERELLRCVKLCRTAGLERPEARARLALAWARKEQNAPVDDVVAAFDDALKLAEAHGDPATATDAHRQLGFFAWVSSP